MANKTYSIVINGLQESIKAVDALNSSLGELDKKIRALEGKAVKIGSTSSGGGSKSSSTGALSEEEKIHKQIAQLEEKRIAHSKEIYQNYLAAKDVLKEVDNDQKSIAATERLQAKSYSNTIQGMKQELADIKSAMQTVDLGDTGQLDKMTQRANELNNALKKIEESYGQFGRNVGNYAEGVAQGMAEAGKSATAIKVEINGVTREFTDARQASRELSNELKSMAINGQQGTKEFKELQKAVAQLNSDMKDATVSSTAMDNMLDTLQGFAAIGSIGEGFSALFGIDNDEIDRSIQKLVALQNVMQGIEEIRQQMNTGEGIGGWFSKGNDAIDSLVEKLTGANKAQVALNASTTAGKTASEGLAVAETAQAAATTTATVATKALSLALKTIGIGLIISAVAYLITYWKEIYKWFTDTIPALKNLSTWFDKIKAVVMGVGSAIVNYMVQPFATLAKVIKALIEGNFSEIPNIISNGFKKTFNIVGNFQKGYNKEIERQQTEHNRKVRENQKKANEELLKDEEAKYGQSHKRTQEYLKKQLALTDKGSDEYKDLQRKLWEDERREREEHNSKSLSTQKQANKDELEAQKDITSLQLRTMKDGLNKQLMQLDEEKRQTINKIKENGNRVGQQIKQVEEAYSQIRLNIIQDYLNKLTNTVNESAKKISSIRFSIDTKDIELNINEIEEKIKEMTDDVVPINNTLTTKLEYGNENQALLKFATDFDYQKGKARTEEELKEYFKWLEETVSLFSKDVQDKLKTQNVLTGEMELDYNAAEKYIEEHYKKELNIVRSYGYQENASLSSSFEFRLNALRAYDADYIAEIDKALEAEMEEKQKAADLEKKQALANNKTQYDETVKSFRERKQEIEKGLAAIEKVTTDAGKEMTDKEKEKYDKLKENLETTNKQIEETQKQYADKVNQIAKEHGQKLVEIERQATEKRQQNQQRYYDKQLSNYRDFLSKINSESAKQPVTDKAGFGIVNVAATKKNYNEILSAAKTTLDNIKKDRDKLNEDFKKGLIKPENYNATLNQLNDLENETKQTAQTVADSLKNVNATFVQSLQMYLQATLEAYNKIMSAVWDAQDTAFDKEQEQIDKENEMLQNALDEKKDLISKYKSEIDSIEDELATSRGDRRQHLIDQLNAEMAAEREAAKQKQKIEEDQQKQQAKQDKLDEKRRKAEYHRNLTQAIVNGAMAVTMAAINSWPIPAIPMMALAGATTAAQIAIMAANKPYAKGGQLEGGVAVGPRHRDGGIPVLGKSGWVSIEGGEFITNRLSTANNVDLLEFINSKKKRIDVSDLIDFYSSGNIKRNISGIKTKFEDGGYIPSLPNSIDVFDNRLIQSFEAYSNRPIYVTVTDIENRMEQVKYVRTLAGVGQN